MTTDPVLITTSHGMRRLRWLPVALGLPLVSRPRGRPVAAVLGWGRKATATRAARRAAELGVPAWCVEDGFIRSVGLGVAGAEPFGFTVDTTGVAYDATAPSDLEGLIAAGAPADPRATELLTRLVAARASKYNHCWRAPRLSASVRERILLVDQTRGDLSVRLGLADEATFARMLAAARARHPNAELLIKAHPDVLAGKRRGHLTELDLRGCTVLDHDCNPLELLLRVDQVHVVSSQLGFEALLAGRRVRCFGMPFYAGWGLTEDEGTCPRREVKRTLDQVFWSAYGVYTRYADPLTGQRCGLERVIERIADHGRVARREGGTCWTVGLTPRKRRVVPPFLPGSTVHHLAPGQVASHAQNGDRVLTWGYRADEQARALAGRLGATVERIEDGFLRSVGLGSDFVLPLSLVVDRRGLYFDPRGPSDLEHLLATAEPRFAELERGAALIARLRTSGVTKYNTGLARALVLPPAAAGRRVLLVPGQVEDDLSIRFGCVDVRTNRDLLAAVRAANPQAFVVFKPHPDVLAGNRVGAVPADQSRALADLVVTDVDMAACLRAVHEVHTMTSQTGFEALIHGLAVSAYGLPFYAGWGLTSDRHACPRRGRHLSLEALVFLTLVRYPRYRDPGSGLFTTPEATIDLIERRRAAAGDTAIALPRWLRWTRQMGRLVSQTWRR